MDRAWFLFLNGLPATVPGLGAIAVLVARDTVALYGVLLLWLWWRGSRQPERGRQVLLLAALAALLSLGINLILNAVMPRPRPFMVLPAHVLVASPPHDASFPSDHAAVTASIAVTLFLGGEPGWGGLGLLGAVLVGVARVIVGLHYPSDVLGGWLVGTACAAAVIRAEGPLRPATRRLVEVARRLRLA